MRSLLSLIRGYKKEPEKTTHGKPSYLFMPTQMIYEYDQFMGLYYPVIPNEKGNLIPVNVVEIRQNPYFKEIKEKNDENTTKR